MSGDPTFWLLARASGFTAYGLLTASVLAGLILRARPFGKALKPASVTEVHRVLAWLGLALLGVHGAALVADDAVDISPWALLVPGIAPYRPLWTALGVVTGLVMIILVVSFPLRKIIGTRAWRLIHFASFPAFALGTAHGLMAGTDSNRPWATAVYATAIGLVAMATAYRAMMAPKRSRKKSRARAPHRAAGTTPTAEMPAAAPMPAEAAARTEEIPAPPRPTVTTEHAPSPA